LDQRRVPRGGTWVCCAQGVDETLLGVSIALILSD